MKAAGKTDRDRYDDRYSAAVIDHFEHPRHATGLPRGPEALRAAAGSSAAGVRFVLGARLCHDRLAELAFQAYGCPHCLAAASWLCEQLQGACLEQLEAWRWQQAAAALDVPVAKHGRLLVLEDAVRALGAAWRARQAGVPAAGQEDAAAG